MAAGSPEAADPTPRSVVFVTNGLSLGGAETQTVRVATEFARRGIEVRILSILPSTAFEDELRAHSIELVELIDGTRFAGPKVVWNATKLLRQWKPDAIIGFVFQSNMLARIAGRLAGVPRVVSSFRLQTEKNSKRELIVRLTDPLTSVSTFDSQRVADATVARHATKAKKVRVIPNAIDVDALEAGAAQRDATRDELGLDDQFVWLIVGRLVHEKDHQTLLAAWELLGHEHPRRRTLLVVGEGVLRDELVAAAEQRGISDSVRWLGARRDVPRLLAACDAFVLSSTTESSPNALLEAASMGRPAVATNVGGTREFDPTGEAIRYVESRSPEDLAKAMAEVETANDEGARLAVRDRLRKSHNLAQTADLWLDACRPNH
ncbi:MAG: glycosyltransferase [Acidimicrobiales bacterium]